MYSGKSNIIKRLGNNGKEKNEHTKLDNKTSGLWWLALSGTTCSVDAWALAQIVTCYMFVFYLVWI